MHVNQAYLIIAIFSTIWNFSSAARHKYRPNFPQSIHANLIRALDICSKILGASTNYFGVEEDEFWKEITRLSALDTY